MKNHLGSLALCAATALVARAQIADSKPASIANIPVNYTEAKTGSYTLPDPLKLADGTPVTDAKTWFEKRRPEIFKIVEENEYGRVPGRPDAMTFDVFDKGTPAFDGKALRKQVTIYFTASKTEHYVDVLIYLPANAAGPVPVLLNFGWTGNNLAASTDPGVKVGRQWSAQEKKRVPSVPAPTPPAGGRGGGGPGRNVNVMQVVDRGYGFAIFNYNDIDVDQLNALEHGIRAAYLKPGQTTPASDEWGSVAAWGWGASRIIDYFETDPAIDAKRITITGASRLGKTVLWEAARDERIACVISSISGEGGAALSRRDYGETVAHLVAPSRFPYQFAINYQKWQGTKFQDAPWDAHMIIALVAPRPILLQTGSTDTWSDPYGEFLAAKAATPVFELLGKKGIEQYSQPGLGKPLMNTLGYLMHDGPHGVQAVDWPIFLDFMDAHLKPAK